MPQEPLLYLISVQNILPLNYSSRRKGYRPLRAIENSFDLVHLLRPIISAHIFKDATLFDTSS